MKRLIQILFLNIYLISSIGLNVVYHFCGDTLHSTIIDLKGNTEEPVDCCAEKSENDACCHNEIKIFKILDKYSPTLKIELTSIPIIITYIPDENEKEILQTIIRVALNQQYPPGKLISIQNRALLI